MSAAETINIADEVVRLLNSAPIGTFAYPFRATRRYVPLYTKEELANIAVSVVPRARQRQFIARNQEQSVHEIHLAVQQAIDIPENGAQIDTLTAMVDAILAWLEGDDSLGRTRRLLAVSSAMLTKVENDPLYDPAHLKDLSIFTSLVTLTYEKTRMFR